jgi:hypothetical protein
MAGALGDCLECSAGSSGFRVFSCVVVSVLKEGVALLYSYTYLKTSSTSGTASRNTFGPSPIVFGGMRLSHIYKGVLI